MTTAAPTVGPFRYPLALLTAALRDPELTKTAMKLLGVLVDHAATKGECFLSDAAIGTLTGMHRVTIKRAGELLLRLGWITRVDRGKHKGRATVYALPLEREPAPQSAALNVALSDDDDRPAVPQSAAPPHSKAPRPGTTKRRAAARRQPLHGTYGGTHHGDELHGFGSPSHPGPGPSAPPIPRPPAEAGVKAWGEWAMEVADSRAGLAATRQAAEEAAGAIAGRLGSKCPDVIRKPLREAARGPGADRGRLLEALANADHLLRLGKSPSEAGTRFGAILKGTARPHFEPVPGSEAAAAARRPEPGRVRRPARPSAVGGELTELARELAVRPAEVLGFAVGRPDAEQPPPAPPSPAPDRPAEGDRVPFVAPSESELKRKLPEARRIWKSWLPQPEGGGRP